MSIAYGIQGHLLEVTVVCCTRLKDTEWISRQDPYVSVEYGSTKFRTRTCTDGGKNPTFQEKFTFTLIEGLRELNVVVWNSNTLTYDDFIGSGKVLLQRVLSQGFEDSSWPLQTKSGRHAGEVRLIMRYENVKIPTTGYVSSAPTYMAPTFSQTTSFPLPAKSASPYPAPTGYPTPPYGYPPNSLGYPPPPQPSTYSPAYAQPSVYPPPYPPPPKDSPYYPPGSFPGVYPPPY